MWSLIKSDQVQPFIVLGFSPLQHSLHSDSVEVCLITKDESSKVKEMLKAKAVTVKKVCLTSLCIFCFAKKH